MSKKTPLYEQHRQAHAKIVDFGGWDMPLHYGSQLEEHRQVRATAGVFDVSHMTVVDVTGQQAQAFLRYLLANDVSRLNGVGKALYTCMLNAEGGIIDDLIVYYQSSEQYRMVVNAATRDKDLAWIRQHAEHFVVTVKERPELAMLAVQGPQARAHTQAYLPPTLQAAAMDLKPFHACWDELYFVARTGYTGEDGFEVILPAIEAVELWQQLVKAGVQPAGLGARDTLRIEAGLNLYGTDMDETITPLESGLAWTVAWEPASRDFIGRTALTAQRERGDHAVFKGLILEGKGILRSHQTVQLSDGRTGAVTSGTFSPTLGLSIGMARLPATEETTVQVAIRQKLLAARVVKPPFVRHGKACIDMSK